MKTVRPQSALPDVRKRLRGWGRKKRKRDCEIVPSRSFPNSQSLFFSAKVVALVSFSVRGAGGVCQALGGFAREEATELINVAADLLEESPPGTSG